jgi:hypothetical protein
MTKHTTITKRNSTKRLSIWACVVAAILMIPYVAKFPWTGSDFVFAGVVLFGCASVYELTTRNMKDRNDRIMVAIAVLTVLIFIWGLAVTGE